MSRLSRTNVTCILLAVVAGGVCLWTWGEGFTFRVSADPTMEALLAGQTAIVLALWGYCRRRIPRLAPLLMGFLQLELTMLIMAVLWVAQYPAAAANFPEVDAAFLRLDAALGIDWPAMYRYVAARPPLYDFLRWIYPWVIPQISLVCIAVGYWDPKRLEQFVQANFLALFATILLFGLLPAEGPIPYLDLPETSYEATTAAVFHGLRDGSIRWIDPQQMIGMIAFPSYHAVLAVLVMFACARLPGPLPYLSAALQVLILLSTPIMGNHYVVDLIGGAIVAGLAIVVVSPEYRRAFALSGASRLSVPPGP